MSIRVPDMTGQVVLVTGSSSGIGAVAAGRLAQAGATLIPVGRSPERTARLAGGWGVKPYLADFASFDSVRELAEQIAADHPRVDVIAHNAGGFHSQRAETVDGHDLTMQTNYFSMFLLNHLLTPQLLAAPAPRVVITSSAMHRIGRLRLDDLDRRRGRYNAGATYGASKLAATLFAAELSRRYGNQGLIAASFHPGVVATGIGADSAAGPRPDVPLSNAGRMQRTPEEGAEPLLYLATTPDRERIAGAYFSRLRKVRPRRAARSQRLASELWDATATLIGLPAGS